MKTLYLVRHAKSSWKYKELKDIDRPLKKRGKKNADFIAKLLKKNNNIPELLISSSAKRAFDTAEIFAKIFKLKQDKIIKNEKLYMADYDDFVAAINEIHEEINNAMLFGHNPGLTYFACAITEDDIDNIPTCGIVRIDFDVNSWNELSSRKGKFVFFEFPKKHKIQGDNN